MDPSSKKLLSNPVPLATFTMAPCYVLVSSSLLFIPPAFMPTGIMFSLFRSYVCSLVRFFVRNSRTFVEFVKVLVKVSLEVYIS